MMNGARQEQRLSSAAVNTSSRGPAEQAGSSPELPSSAIVDRLLSDRYVPDLLLDQSSFSVRYRARDGVIDETVCLELLPRTATTRFAQIRRAAAKLAALGDHNIVDVIGLGLVGGAWPFLVTEHTPHTLREALGAGPLELSRVVRLGAQAAGALAAAHGAGVLHGALALDRIALFGEGPLEVAKLSGFGIMAVDAPGALRADAAEARHASPERLAGVPLDARSDVYAIGTILYELATGAPPEAPGPRSGAPEPPSRRRGSTELAFRAFDKIVERCLARAPEDRYPNAAELAADLGRLDAALERAAAAARARAAQVKSELGAPESSRSGARHAGGDRSSGVALSPARRPPQRSAVSMRALPKVIVRSH